MDACEVRELARLHLIHWNPELKLQASLCGIPDPQCALLNGLSRGVQRVGAAGVGVVARESDLRVERHAITGCYDYLPGQCSCLLQVPGKGNGLRGKEYLVTKLGS